MRDSSRTLPDRSPEKTGIVPEGTGTLKRTLKRTPEGTPEKRPETAPAPDQTMPLCSLPRVRPACALQLRPLDLRDGFNTSINTTPLVDVMLVLLIVFLVTLPMVSATVPISLPRANAANSASVLSPRALVLSLREDGGLFWGDEPVSFAEMSLRLQALAALPIPPEVRVRADRRLPYAQVSKILLVGEQVGLAGVSFVLEPSLSTSPSP